MVKKNPTIKTLKQTKTNNINLAIVIPTYNERENIEKLLKVIKSKHKASTIFVVDDNSPDKTWEVVNKMAKKDKTIRLILRKKKEGIGRAYLHGFTEALKYNPQFLVQMDADFSHDPAYIKEMLQVIKKQDVAIGSRYVDGISVVNWSFSRILLSYFANKYVDFFLRMNIKDSTGGFKCFRAEVFRQIDFNSITSDGYSFQIEMNYILKKMGFKMKEFPILFRDRDVGLSKMNKKIILEALLKVPLFLFQSKKKYLKKIKKRN